MAPGAITGRFQGLLWSLLVVLLCCSAAADASWCPRSVSVTTDPGRNTSTKVAWTVLTSGGVPATCNATSGSPLPLGSTVVECKGADRQGNLSACSFQVTVEDEEAPVVHGCVRGPLRRTIRDFDPQQRAPSLTLPVTWTEEAWAEDNSGREARLSVSHPSGSEFPLGITRVTYTATDEAGNANTSCWFYVQVVVQPQGGVECINNVLKSATNSCLVIAWPQSVDESVKEYTLRYGIAGERQREVIATPVLKGGLITTYNKQQICSLVPGQLYTVELMTDLGDNRGTSARVWTEPQPPKNLSLVPGTLTTSSAVLTWTPVSLQYVEQYLVTIGRSRKNMRELTWTYVTNTTSSFLVESLRPDTWYTATVKAIVGSGTLQVTSSNSKCSFQTDSPAASELLVYNYTESSIKLVWQNEFKPIQLEPYMLFIEPQDAEKSFLTAHQSDNLTTASFQGLQPNREYYIRLIHNSGLSLNTTQRTRPGRVRNLRPVEVLADAITLAWDPPLEGAVDFYRVHFSPGDHSGTIVVRSTSHRFRMLTLGTEYYFRLVSVHHGVESVPQSTLVTAGVTEPVRSSEHMPTFVVWAVMGGTCGVLLVCNIMICIKYCLEVKRPKQKRNQAEAPPTETVKMSSTPHYRQDANDADLYEPTGGEDTPQRYVSSSPNYLNTTIPLRQNKPATVFTKKQRLTDPSQESDYMVPDVRQ